MRLGVFSTTDNDERRAGVIDGDEVVDVSAQVPSAGPAGPWQAFIAAGTDPAALDLTAGTRHPLDAVAWHAPLPHPGKILGAPANYRAHVAEMGNPNTIAEWGMFLKASSSVIGPGENIELPYTDLRTDHEGELAVVIGRAARNVGRSQALEHVFGYSIVLDITIRSTEDRSTRKSFDTFTPLGPWIVTADEFGDPADVDLKLWVNDEQRQSSSTALMIYDVPRQIEYASHVMTLNPGDVIATGTPEGVGPLVDGDQVRCAVAGVGELVVGVSAANARPYASRLGEGA